jgi:hypothetical protein
MAVVTNKRTSIGSRASRPARAAATKKKDVAASYNKSKER